MESAIAWASAAGARGWLATGMGSLLPYARARTLMAEFLPLGDVPAVETTRRRTMRVGARLEQQAAHSTAKGFSHELPDRTALGAALIMSIRARNAAGTCR
jgi:hypothetical protein